MSEWIVYSKDGLTERCTVKKLEYNGEWLGACNLNVTVTSPTPINFELGDYLVYRGERFEINYDPTVIKVSSVNTYGEGFKYENIIFNSLSDELTRCDFLDYVPSDNLIHYSSLPNFSFFADTIDKLAERIKVNLDRIYKGEKEWTIEVHSEYVNKTDVNITVNSINCWEALALVKTQFDANFIIRGRKIIIGTEGIAVDKVFSYGKGNGLVSIERNAESDQKIITRLRAYGSTKNMPESYYKNIGLKVFIPKPSYEVFESAATIYIGTLYNGKDMFNNEWEGVSDTYKAYKVTIRLNKVVVTALVAMNEGDVDSYINLDSAYNNASDLATFLNELKGSYTKIYFESGVNKTAFPYDCREYLENIPNNMAVMNLMLPDFPDKSLDPYIDSENIEELGVREGTVFFDGSGDLEEIYPSMEGMTAEDLISAGINVSATGALDEVVSADSIQDDGVYKEGAKISDFTITLKDIGFDINEHLSTDSATISMKSGMCGGREFEISKCVKSGNNYIITCKRAYDEGLDLYFPYKDYNIKAGDKFVLLNIEMPDVYIKAASQRLLKAALAYLAANDYTRYSYNLNIDKIFMARQHDRSVIDGIKSLYLTLKEGDIMNFKDTDLNVDDEIIIDTLSIKENLNESLIPQYEVTLRNEKSVSIVDKVQNKVNTTVVDSAIKDVQSNLAKEIQKLKELITSGTGGGGSGALSKDLISNASAVGHAGTGIKFPKGTTFEQMFWAIFFKPTPATLTGKISTANDVEYGTAKGYLTYTATRNGNGAMMDAYYDDLPSNKLSFSDENNGVQTATRQLSGNYTKGETYKATVIYEGSSDKTIPQTTLTNTISVNVKRKWFAGVVSSIPTTSAQVRALGSNGLYNGKGTYKFNVQAWQKLVICIPTDTIHEITVTKYPGNFIEDKGVCTGPTSISVEGANGSTAQTYKMWVIQAATTNDADTFTFKTS